MSNRVKGKVQLKAKLFASPGQEQSLDDLVSLLESRGRVILSVDRVNNRLLIAQEENTVG